MLICKIHWHPLTNFQFEVVKVRKIKQRLVQIPGCHEISDKE